VSFSLSFKAAVQKRDLYVTKIFPEAFFYPMGTGIISYAALKEQGLWQECICLSPLVTWVYKLSLDGPRQAPRE